MYSKTTENQQQQNNYPTQFLVQQSKELLQRRNFRSQIIKSYCKPANTNFSARRKPHQEESWTNSFNQGFTRF